MFNVLISRGNNNASEKILTTWLNDKYTVKTRVTFESIVNLSDYKKQFDIFF